jgi:ribonuclease P protein component
MASSSSLCYPRAARLLRPDDFSALRRSGKRFSLRFFQCEYRMTNAPSARLGMAVSRRISKRAVVRNRIRRQIRESFRLQRVVLPRCDVLIIARAGAAEQANPVLRSELETLWKKLAAATAAEILKHDSSSAPLNPAGAPGTMRGSS